MSESINSACNILIIIGIISLSLFLLFIIYLLYNTIFQETLVSKYDNISKSNFTNKDQVEFFNSSDYDIHYLVEQMIYKEFSPKDKKKYLNLPEALKDSLLKEYLIQKI
jgi:hypothetical protein